MITTVTTTTSVALTSSIAGTLTLIVTLTLMALLIYKEVMEGQQKEWAKRITNALNTAILPLFSVFIVTVALRLAEVLS